MLGLEWGVLFKEIRVCADEQGIHNSMVHITIQGTKVGFVKILSVKMAFKNFRLQVNAL